MRAEDHFTNTPDDARAYEAERGRDDWVDDRPTLAECDHDEAELDGAT